MLDSIVESLCSVLKNFLLFILGIYNNLTGKAVGMLGENPASWNKDGWKFAENVNAVFLGVAAALVVIFFLIGFCSESVDVRQELRMESILRMFLKLSIAEYFTVNSITIVKKSFVIATGFIDKISKKGMSFEFEIPEEINAILEDPVNHSMSGWGGVCWALLLFILTLVFLLVAYGCGMMILYEAFVRFFKILMLVPYGTLANSTLAGNHTLAHSAVSFWKYALGTILEAVTMYMALVLSATVLGSGVINLTSGNTGALYVIGWVLESSFVCMLTLGIVKGASSITQKALGL